MDLSKKVSNEQIIKNVKTRYLIMENKPFGVISYTDEEKIIAFYVFIYSLRFVFLVSQPHLPEFKVFLNRTEIKINIENPVSFFMQLIKLHHDSNSVKYRKKHRIVIDFSLTVDGVEAYECSLRNIFYFIDGDHCETHFLEKELKRRRFF